MERSREEGRKKDGWERNWKGGGGARRVVGFL